MRIGKVCIFLQILNEKVSVLIACLKAIVLAPVGTKGYNEMRN